MSDVVVDVMFLTLDGSDLAQNARLRNLVLFLTENLNNSVLLFKKHQIYITLRMFISVWCLASLSGSLENHQSLFSSYHLCAKNSKHFILNNFIKQVLS